MAGVVVEQAPDEQPMLTLTSTDHLKEVCHLATCGHVVDLISRELARQIRDDHVDLPVRNFSSTALAHRHPPLLRQPAILCHTPHPVRGRYHVLCKISL